MALCLLRVRRSKTSQGAGAALSQLPSVEGTVGEASTENEGQHKLWTTLEFLKESEHHPKQGKTGNLCYVYTAQSTLQISSPDTDHREAVSEGLLMGGLGDR